MGEELKAIMKSRSPEKIHLIDIVVKDFSILNQF